MGNVTVKTDITKCFYQIPWCSNIKQKYEYKAVYIYIYIYICIYMHIFMRVFMHMYVYIYICVCVECFFVVGPKKARNISKWIGPRRDLNLFIYLCRSYIRVFPTFVREHIWHKATQWMVFSWLWVYIEVTFFFSFLRVCLPLSVYP